MTTVNQISQEVLAVYQSLKASGMKFREADSNYEISKRQVVSNAAAPLLFGKYFVKTVDGDDGEFLSAGVCPAIQTANGIQYSDPIKMDRAIGRIPILDSKGDFVDLLPYIEDGSIELRDYKEIKHTNGYSQKGKRIYWRWNNKIQECPVQLEEYTILENRDWDNADNWREIEGDLSLEDFAF